MVKAEGEAASPGAEHDWTNTLRRGRVPGPRLPQQRVFPDTTGSSTKSIHSGTYIDPAIRAVNTPIFQTSTFEFSEHTYDAFEQGHIRDVPIYGRYGSPNQWAVQEKVAALESGQSGVVFSSGMAAITTTLLGLTNHGGNVVTSRDVYGGTFTFLRENMHQFGREVTFVEPTDFEQIRDAVKDNTQVLFFETLTNPLMKAIPLVELGQLAKERNLLLVIDNTFLTPYCLRPLDYGAHVVIHSATKYLNGHSDLVAGVATGSRKYLDRIWSLMLRLGGSLDAQSCSLLERGLKTLGLRMRAHVENAAAIMEYLGSHERVRKVHHPSAPDYPYPWIREICPDGYGGMLSFEVEGGDEAALKFLDRLRIPIVATSLGGVESLVSLPFNTSHSFFTLQQRREVGIEPGLVRLSVGVEDAADLIADLDQALASI